VTLDRTVALLVQATGDLLDRPGVRPGDHFFEIGGHSVAATRLMARVRSELRVNLPVTAVFATPVLAELAARIVDSSGTPTAPPGLPKEPASLTDAQRRQWFLQQLAADGAAYNIPLVVRVRGELDTAALRLALKDLVERHEILRTTYRTADGHPTPVVRPPDAFTVGMVRVPAAEVDDWLVKEVRRPFDLASALPVRAVIGRVDRTDHILAMVVHHIAADGWSRSIIVDDLAALYAFHRGQGRYPDPPSVQYADVPMPSADDVTLDWWARRLAGAPSHTTFPADRSRPPVLTDAGRTVPVEIDAELARRIRATARASGTTVYTVLMAALQLYLARSSSVSDIVVATSVAGRELVGAEDVVGCFINTIAVRTDVSGNPDTRQLLSRVWDSTVAALEHAYASFDDVVRRLAAPRDTAWRPVFQVMLTVHNEPPIRPRLGDAEAEWIEVDNGGAKCDVFIAITEDGGPLRGSLSYRTQLFDLASAQRLAAGYTATLAEIAEEPKES
jgi:hypothetical protein